MPDLSLLFAFWSPGAGFNWNLLVGWALAFVFAKGLFPKVTERISDKLLKLLNRIPFFENTDLDERFFDVVHKHLSTQVLAQMSKAKEIKTEYHFEIAKALEKKEHDKVKLLSREMRTKLEELTKNVADGFFADSEGILWQSLEQKYGDKTKAWKWVYQKVKALVEELRQPDHPSTTVLITKHIVNALGDLGNSRSSEGLSVSP